MRHGHSMANEEGIILSDPAVGTIRYGLSGKGKSQVIEAASNFDPLLPCIIYTSDFLRTVQTAELLGRELHIGEIIKTELLRERFFGAYEGQSNRFYEDIWEKDRDDDDNCFNGVESPASVAARTGRLLGELEAHHKNSIIILVSHGDCLQIMQTVFAGLPPRSHRSLPHLETAEIRAV